MLYGGGYNKNNNNGGPGPISKALVFFIGGPALAAMIIDGIHGHSLAGSDISPARIEPPKTIFTPPPAMTKHFTDDPKNEEQYQWFQVNQLTVFKICRNDQSCGTRLTELVARKAKYLTCAYNDNANGGNMINYRAWYETVPKYATAEMKQCFGDSALSKCPTTAADAAQVFHRDDKRYNQIDLAFGN